MPLHEKFQVVDAEFVSTTQRELYALADRIAPAFAAHASAAEMAAAAQAYNELEERILKLPGMQRPEAETSEKLSWQSVAQQAVASLSQIGQAYMMRSAPTSAEAKGQAAPPIPPLPGGVTPDDIREFLAWKAARDGGNQ